MILCSISLLSRLPMVPSYAVPSRDGWKYYKGSCSHRVNEEYHKRPVCIISHQFTACAVSRYLLNNMSREMKKRSVALVMLSTVESSITSHKTGYSCNFWVLWYIVFRVCKNKAKGFWSVVYWFSTFLGLSHFAVWRRWKKIPPPGGERGEKEKLPHRR